MKALVISPTYNERENIRELIQVIEETVKTPGLEILVVDSASPDGTAAVVDERRKGDRRLHLLNQPKKLGLGRAYRDGMRWALERDYDVIVTMDADFSHHPRYIDTMLAGIAEADLVIGSRYIPGGELRNWPWRRRALSRTANWFAGLMVGLPVSDLTSGFHAFRQPLLRAILAKPLATEGYAFLVELKYLAVMAGARITEVPIIFSDRTKGQSKISRKVIFESIRFVFRLALRRIRQKRPPTPSGSADAG